MPPRRSLPRPVSPFTAVQMDALLCLAEGLTTEDAADRCGVRPRRARVAVGVLRGAAARAARLRGARALPRADTTRP